MSCYEISLSFIFKQQMCEHFLHVEVTKKQWQKDKKKGKERKKDRWTNDKDVHEKSKEVM